MVESIWECAFENAKVRMQAGNRHLYTSSADCMRQMVGAGGIAALYRGFSAHSLRNVVWNACYFGVFKSASDVYPTKPEDSHAKQLFQKFVTGAIAGGTGCFLNTPLDVVKSRMQAEGLVSEPAYRSVGQSLGKVAREEGLLALWRGLGPRVFRLGVGGGIMVVVYDTMMRLLD